MTKLDKLRQRIASIFEMKDVPSVDIETLERYLDYLKKHLELPCQLTGIEDFPWEEFYVIGSGNKEEHERLRKTRPSYMDTYELLSFDDVESDSGIFVNVQRVSDKKEFVLPLADLEATERKIEKLRVAR